MSFWDDILGGLGFDQVEGAVGKMFGLPSADEKRRQQQMMQQQIDAYKQQTELTRQQVANAQNAQDAQQRMINEKQIRNLRRSYRPAGILGTGQPAAPDVSSQLGG